jgi:HEAT repeat protein
MKMLRSSTADEREDAGGVLGGIGRYFDAALPDIVASMDTETDPAARDSLIQALGELHNKQAVPYLARVILDPATDGDTAFTAALSLGQIVRRRFDRSGDPVVGAKQWLEAHGDVGSR